MSLKSVLKPSESVMTALAVAGTVYAIYNLDVGSVSQAAASTPNHPALESSRKKAGYTSYIVVAALTLITKDGNVGVIGFASIVAMEIHYRTAIMSDPVTGQIVAPSAAAYVPAENVVPINAQAQTG